MKDLNLIELTDLEKRYGKKEALTGINLTIGRGKIIGLLGPNGSGKTTLIKLLNGLLQPTSGEIKVNGKAPGVDSKKIISYLPDKMYFENVALSDGYGKLQYSYKNSRVTFAIEKTSETFFKPNIKFFLIT
mgnify:CR=1 FL=1